MRSNRVDSIESYLSPTEPRWERVGSTRVDMIPAPLPMQPTDYIRRSWENKPYGQTTPLEVASMHDGETWAIRVKWKSGKPGSRDFSDALAIALPVRNNPPLMLMGGGENAPIHMLRWEATRKETVMSLRATGIGRSAPGPELKCGARAAQENQIWSVVIARALGAGNDIAPLIAGQKTTIGFAVWNGANDERAGIKAFSIDWIDLVLDA